MTILIILLCLAALWLLFSLCVYHIAFHSPNRTQNNDFTIARGEQMEQVRDTVVSMITGLREIPFERVGIVSDDSLQLNGRYYQTQDGAPVVIAFHGYRGTPTRDFAGGAQMYLSAGFNLLMIEQRAHCSSQGHTITFGIRERYDGIRWIRFVRDRFGPETPVILAGISMGAATVLMMSALDLPANVVGILADAPYTSPEAIIRKVCHDFGVPPKLAMPFLRSGAKLFGGFGLSDADAAEAVKQASVPILLIHGEDDRFVPCDMGRSIAAANPDRIELLTFPGAGHGLSFLVDRERYAQAASGFLQRILHDHTSE